MVWKWALKAKAMWKVSGSRPDGAQDKKEKKKYEKRLGNMKKEKREEWSWGKTSIGDRTARDNATARDSAIARESAQ